MKPENSGKQTDLYLDDGFESSTGGGSDTDEETKEMKRRFRVRSKNDAGDNRKKS